MHFHIVQRIVEQIFVDLVGKIAVRCRTNTAHSGLSEPASHDLNHLEIPIALVLCEKVPRNLLDLVHGQTNSQHIVILTALQQLNQFLFVRNFIAAQMVF